MSNFTNNTEKAWALESRVELKLNVIFWNYLSQWRIWIWFLLVLPLLAGGYKGLSMLKQYREKEDKNVLEAEYQKALEEYEVTVGEIDKLIAQKNEEKEQRINGESFWLFYAIDPQNVYTASFSYYFDTHYQIDVEKSYQNPDYTSAVVHAVQKAINDIHVEDYIDSNLSCQNPESGSGLRILTASVDDEANILTVTCYGESQKMIDQIKNAVEATVEETCKDLRKDIGDFDCTFLTESVWCGENRDIQWIQTNKSNMIISIGSTINDLEKQKSSLTKPIGITYISKSNVLVKTGAFCVAGFILALIMTMGLSFLEYLGNDRLISVNEITERYSIPLLGSVSMNKGKLRWDRCILNHLSRDIFEVKEDERLKLASLRIIDAFIKCKDENQNVIALTGNADDTVLKTLADSIKELAPELKVTIVGNAKASHVSLKNLVQQETVVLVEKRLTKHREISDELTMMKELNKVVLGIIVE